MLQIFPMTENDLAQGADLVAAAYREPPWQEHYEPLSLWRYLESFLAGSDRFCYLLKQEDRAVGLALCLRIPDIGGWYFRVEEFCILPSEQRKGYGSRFLALLCKQAKVQGADSLLLGTQRDVPARSFYLKNGFREIPSAVTLYRKIK